MSVTERVKQNEFQVPLNTDHRLTAEQLFVPDERKEETGRKKREIRETYIKTQKC